MIRERNLLNPITLILLTITLVLISNYLKTFGNFIGERTTETLKNYPLYK